MGVEFGELPPLGALAPRAGHDRDPATAEFTQGGFEQGRLVMRSVDDDLGRGLVLEIEARQKGRDDLGRVRLGRQARIERPAAEVAAGTDMEDLDTGLASLDGAGHDVDIGPTAGIADELPLLEAPQQRDPIAETRRRLEIESFGGLVHPAGETIGHDLLTPLDEEHGVFDVTRVVVMRYQADTRRRTATDLVLQTRA